MKRGREEEGKRSPVVVQQINAKSTAAERVRSRKWENGDSAMWRVGKSQVLLRWP